MSFLWRHRERKKEKCDLRCVLSKRTGTRGCDTRTRACESPNALLGAGGRAREGLGQHTAEGKEQAVCRGWRTAAGSLNITMKMSIEA